jgi:hypothetical protein
MDAVAVCRHGAPTAYIEARRANFGAGCIYGADCPLALTPVRAAPPLADAGLLANAEEFEGGHAVALVLRGTVNFVEKARAAQAAGAAALIVLNTEEENFIPSAPHGDDAADVAIPVVCVSAAWADQLLAMADAAKAGITTVDSALGGAGNDDMAGAGVETRLGLLFSATNLRSAIENGTCRHSTYKTDLHHLNSHGNMWQLLRFSESFNGKTADAFAMGYTFVSAFPWRVEET